MTLIADTFARVSGRPLLIPFLAVGFPHADLTLPLLSAVADAGADMIELGVPFSDPMADGPAIQRAYEKSLENGMNLDKTLAIAAEFRLRNTQTPLVLMGYSNTFFRHKQFVDSIAHVGINGLIVVDLDDSERTVWRQKLAASEIDLISLLAPTSSPERQKKILADSAGFVYYITLKGVTGARHLAATDVSEKIIDLKKQTTTPIVAGFGCAHKSGRAKIGFRRGWDSDWQSFGGACRRM